MKTERHNTKIEWTHLPGYRGETWNPVVGCTKVSQGCKHCYAETLHTRRHHAYKAEAKLPEQYAVPFNRVQVLEERLERPLRWKKPRAVFVNSLSDLFHEDVPQGFIDEVFAVMALTPRHRFMALTKRHEQMRDYITNVAVHERVSQVAEGLIDRYGTRHEKWDNSRRRGTLTPTVRTWPLTNVWLGVSVEDQKAAETRIPVLVETPAAVRFLSFEPLLGPLDFDLSGISWVIAGAESGAGARPMDEAWVRGIRDACQDAQVPFFYKQNAAKGRKLSVPELDGRRWEEFPSLKR